MIIRCFEIILSIMNRFYPGVCVRAAKEIVSTQGELVGANPTIIKEGSIGRVITKRECRKGTDNPRIVVQFSHASCSSGVLVSCTLDMVILAE